MPVEANPAVVGTDTLAPTTICVHPSCFCRPSPIDHFKNFSSCLPVTVFQPPFKRFPFPMTSPTETYRRPIHGALDLFAIKIPLLKRHEVPSVCPPMINQLDEDMKSYNDDIFPKHPHVVTRTHLRVVRESRLFRGDGYLGMHEHLRNSSCGQDRPDERTPRLDDCRRSYYQNGNWETMLQLPVTDPEAEGGFRDEFACVP
ncbi:hypothetical protein DFH09DRAFT_1179831 [Mycena vulgaris]|nr:hypothetical protein DFH09DRAFT_1185837 [Mycena vulgaris]KAJ6535287.1 hypothetical protein DFH09DRAFT_1179831 [Mycena vulgaris]